MSNLKEERKAFEGLGLSYEFNNQINFDAITLGGIQNYWFIPSEVISPEIIIFLHGGGYIYGSITSHRSMVSHMAAATGRKILFVEYSLAPEKPFPNALNETIKVIQALSQTNPGIQFALMGDSAGGNLVMSAALTLKKNNMQAPLYQVLISPWLNMKTEYASYAENEQLDPIITKEFVNYAATLYAGDHDLSDPLISPIHGSFAGLGRTLIQVGDKEVLRDDALHLHQALEKAGCTSVLQIFENVTHVWVLTNIASPESKQALQNIRAFTNQQ